MPGFKIQEIRSLETPSLAPPMLKTKLGEVIQNSTNVHTRIESINPETGEYKLVLQGTLNQESKY